METLDLSKRVGQSVVKDWGKFLGVTWATLKGRKKKFTRSIYLMAAGILAFGIAAYCMHDQLWYLGCALVTGAAFLYQMYCITIAVGMVYANYVFENIAAGVLKKSLEGIQVPLEKTNKVIDDIRARFTEIIKQPKDELGDAILSALNESLRLLQVPGTILQVSAQGAQELVGAIHKGIAEIPEKTEQRLKERATPLLRAYLNLEFLSIAFWALLAFSPPGPLTPVFVLCTGLAATAFAYPNRTRGGWAWLAYALSVCVALFGAWGVAMPDHWQVFTSKIEDNNRVAYPEVEVMVPGPRYHKDNELCTPARQSRLERGVRLRLSMNKPFRDKVGNVFVEVLGVVDPATGMVDPATETFQFPKGSVSEPIPEEARGAKFTRQPGLKLDPYAIWDLTATEPVQVVGFNPNTWPAVVKANTKIAHPLGDHRITPIVHYGITQQWDGKTHWGSDFPCSPGSPVYAGATGTVIAVYPATPGTVSGVVIRQNLREGTFYTRYMEVGETLVTLGDVVGKDQLIARTDGRPGKPGSDPSANEAHLHLEVWAFTQEYHAYVPVDPTTWISDVNYQEIQAGPKQVVAYPLYPLPGTTDEYEVPVNRPASFIATKVLTNDQVSIQVLDTQNASYVINATKRDQAFYRAPITVKGKPYPHDNRDESIRTLFRFYADPKLAAFGQLIAGVNGFADAQGMDYGPREFWVKEDGWLYFGINEPTGFLATGELTTDQSADNYTPRGRNAIRVQVTIRRNGAII